MSRLTHVFSSVLGIPESQVTPELSPANAPSWDSLNAIILLTEIEKAFSVRFAYDEAMAIKDFAGVLELIKSKGLDPYAD